MQGSEEMIGGGEHKNIIIKYGTLHANRNHPFASKSCQSFCGDVKAAHP